MEFFRFALNEYQLAVLMLFMLLAPAAFYVMGLMEGGQGRAGRRMFIAGLVLHFLSIAHRGLLLGWLPITEKRDNISFMTFVLALLYFYLDGRMDSRGGEADKGMDKNMKNLQWLVIPLICVLIFVAVMHRTVNTLSPFMLTPWFFAHTFFYFLSYAFFALAACLGTQYIISGRAEVEVFQYRMLSLGWILFSVSLFAGSVWFYLAYGTYWLWTSRELWIAITWLWLGLYLHARLMRGYRGEPVAVLGVLVFAVALFAYFGVGSVISSPPTQF